MGKYDGVWAGLLSGVQEGVKSYGQRSSEIEKHGLLKEQNNFDKQIKLKSAGLIEQKGEDGTTSFVPDPEHRRMQNAETIRKATAEGKILRENPETGDLELVGYAPGYIKGQQEIYRAKAEGDPYGSKALAAALAKQNLSDKQKEAEEKEQGLITPHGKAKTQKDAEEINKATDMKKKFDRQVNELISLREKYGVEYLNRNAVERGKQLSNDILLKYKNLAKLGVLSQADKDIIDAIIPQDPLGQDYAVGQDPILHRLKKFKGDLDSDYETTLSNRLKSGGAQKDNPPKTVIQNGHTYHYNPTTGEYE